jgi:hypothetical protein
MQTQKVVAKILNAFPQQEINEYHIYKFNICSLHRDFNNPYPPKKAHNLYEIINHPKLVGEFMLTDDV